MRVAQLRNASSSWRTASRSRLPPPVPLRSTASPLASDPAALPLPAEAGLVSECASVSQRRTTTPWRVRCESRTPARLRLRPDRCCEPSISMFSVTGGASGPAACMSMTMSDSKPCRKRARGCTRTGKWQRSGSSAAACSRSFHSVLLGDEGGSRVSSSAAKARSARGRGGEQRCRRRRAASYKCAPLLLTERPESDVVVGELHLLVRRQGEDVRAAAKEGDAALGSLGHRTRFGNVSKKSAHALDECPPARASLRPASGDARGRPPQSCDRALEPTAMPPSPHAAARPPDRS